MTTLLETSRQLILVAFMALPLMLICYTFFMGFGLGNVGLIILFFGQIAAVPLAVIFCQTLSSAGTPGLVGIFAISLLIMFLIIFADNIKAATKMS